MKKTVKTYGDGGGTKGSSKSSMLNNRVTRLGKLEKSMAQDTGKGDMDQMSRYNTVVKKLNKATGKLSKSIPAPGVKKASTSSASFKMGGSLSKRQDGGSAEDRMRSIREKAANSVRSTGYKVPVKGTFVAATDSSRKAFMDKYKNTLTKKSTQDTSNVMKKTGGATSAFAKLAPPYNKATFADKIAGAKKKK